MCLVYLKICSPPWIRALKFLYREFLYNTQAVVDLVIKDGDVQ